MLTRLMRRKRWWLVPFVVAAIGGGVAYAAIPDSQGVIHACLKNGSLAVIDTATSSCGKAPELQWYTRQASDSAFLSSTPGSVGSASIADGAVTPGKLSALPAARLNASQLESAPDRTGFGLTFDTTDFMSGGVTVGSSSGFTCLKAPIDGVYQIDAGVQWAPNAAGTRDIDLDVDEGALRPQVIAQSSIPPASDGSAANTTSTLEHIAAGDCVGARVLQNSGATLDVVPGGTFLAMAWVGP